MDSERLRRPCCFDLKTGTKVILWAEVIFATIIFFQQIEEALEHSFDFALEYDGLFIFATFLIIVCNFVGVWGIHHKKPYLLMPGLVLKSAAFLLIIGQLVYLYFYVIGMYVILLAPLIILVLGWGFYSILIGYLCFKEMKEDLRINGPASYNQFYNEAV